MLTFRQSLLGLTPRTATHHRKTTPLHRLKQKNNLRYKRPLTPSKLRLQTNTTSDFKLCLLTCRPCLPSCISLTPRYILSLSCVHARVCVFVCMCVCASMGMGIFLFQLDKLMRTGQLSGDCQIYFAKIRTHLVQHLFYLI